MAEGNWAGSQSNRDAWAITLISKKNCALTNGYRFWPNGKRSILTKTIVEELF